MPGGQGRGRPRLREPVLRRHVDATLAYATGGDHGFRGAVHPATIPSAVPSRHRFRRRDAHRRSRAPHRAPVVRIPSAAHLRCGPPNRLGSVLRGWIASHRVLLCASVVGQVGSTSRRPPMPDSCRQASSAAGWTREVGEAAHRMEHGRDVGAVRRQRRRAALSRRGAVGAISRLSPLSDQPPHFRQGTRWSRALPQPQVPI